MHQAKILLISAACLLLITGILAPGCSDSKKSVNPNLQWSWAAFEPPPAYTPTKFVEFQNTLIALSGFYVYAWDDTGWIEIGYASGGQPSDLEVYDGKLILAGAFTNVNSVSLARIAAWDGANWTALGAGTDGQINDLTVYDSKLIAAGYFDNAGGESANSLAAWDGSTWISLGYGANGAYTVAVYNNKLFTTYNYIFTWDGAVWDTVANVSGSVTDMAVYNSKLIVGGAFSEITYAPRQSPTHLPGIASAQPGDYALTVNHVAAWDGSSWSTLAEGMDDIVYALAAFDNKLIAAGQFTTAGSDSTAYIAAWDGATWAPLGIGPNGEVWALGVWNNMLLASGNFTQAGGVAVDRMASWALR